MYTDINGQTYKLEDNKAIIQQNKRSVKIEIFPTITFENKEYEVVFPDNCYDLFVNENLKEFTLHKLLHPTTNITSMNRMFSCCSKLKNLDLTNLDTDNVFLMDNMFYNSSIENLDITNFNTKKLKCMNWMFENINCKSLNLCSFTSENLKSSHCAFASNKITQFDLSNFNGSFNNSYIFRDCGYIPINDVYSCLIYIDRAKDEYNRVLEFYYKNNKEMYKKLLKYKALFNKCVKTFNRKNFDLKYVLKSCLHVMYINCIVSNYKFIKNSLYDINCNNSYIIGNK